MRRFIKILLIEDNVDDVFFFRLGIGEDEVTLIPVCNAEAAIKHLRSNPLPDLVVTDLKLPGMSIYDFLDWVRKDPHVQTIPIVIYTGSPTVSGELKEAVKDTFFKACSLAENQATVRKMITLAKSKTASLQIRRKLLTLLKPLDQRTVSICQPAAPLRWPARPSPPRVRRPPRRPSPPGNHPGILTPSQPRSSALISG